MRRAILAICATAAALVALLSFKTHTQSPLSTSPAAGSPPAGGEAGSAQGAVPAASAPAAGAAGGQTVTGASWPTIYGPVQVEVSVKNGKVTGVTALVYPKETPMDSQINAFAIPRLNQEAVTASSASIDTVSGATYTSGGYKGSLQSALDKAGL